VGGGQTVRHEYEVTPLSAVQGWVQPATVVYEPTSESTDQQARPAAPDGTCPGVGRAGCSALPALRRQPATHA